MRKSTQRLIGVAISIILILLIFVFVRACAVEKVLGIDDKDEILLPLLLLLSQLGSDQTDSDAADPEPTSNCLNCHSETSERGRMILSAKAGWDDSVHKNGMQSPIVSGTSILGWKWEGSDAFYANGGGCQVCHTHQGFVKKVSGAYANSTEVNNDVIVFPSSIGCFTCHQPHKTGGFELTVASSTKVTLETGGIYQKSKGSICVSCHMTRLSGYASGNALMLSYAIAGYSKTSLPGIGPHNGPQADMLLGYGGATYAGNTYTNSMHTASDNANCVTCHMTMPSSSASLSPNVAGHSFEAVGLVHGVEKGNIAGCTGCHGGATSGTQAGAAGYFHTGDTYMKKDSGDTSATSVSNALTLMADPSNGCNGLLAVAYTQVTGGTFTWKNDIMTRCSLISASANIPANAGATDTTNTTRFLKALWNYTFAKEDRSYGIHNKTYTLQILYDSCADLNNMVGAAVNCGLRP